MLFFVDVVVCEITILMPLTVLIISFHGLAHSKNALFPFLVWAYREQCVHLCVNSP